LGTPPGGGGEGAIDVVWRSFIQTMRILFGILNAQGEEELFHREGARERFASWTTTTDVYWYTNHVSSSASIHRQFYKREITLTGIRLDLPRSMLRGASSEK
jgi:hypothetical protein